MGEGAGEEVEVEEVEEVEVDDEEVGADVEFPRRLDMTVTSKVLIK